MAKTNGKTKKKSKRPNSSETIPLEILDPGHFQSRAEIRAFIVSDEYRAMLYAIDNTLIPTTDCEFNGKRFAGILRDARKGAYGLNQDLATLARAAISKDKQVRAVLCEPSAFPLSEMECVLRALLMVGLGTASAIDVPSDWVRDGLVKHLAGREVCLHA